MKQPNEFEEEVCIDCGKLFRPHWNTAVCPECLCRREEAQEAHDRQPVRSPSNPALWLKSTFTCPACGSPLHRWDGAHGVLLWCGVGKCPSLKANIGAVGLD